MKKRYTGMINTKVKRLEISHINFIKRDVCYKCHLEPNQAKAIKGLPNVYVRMLTRRRIGVQSPYIINKKSPSECA